MLKGAAFFDVSKVKNWKWLRNPVEYSYWTVCLFRQAVKVLNWVDA